MIDRTTTNTIIAAAGITGDRAQVVRLAARMTDDAAGLERMATLLAECDETLAALHLATYQAAWAKTKQREKGARR